MINCPYCQQPVSTFTNSTACAACGRQVLRVPCPSCGRPTLNLTTIARLGAAECFVCHAELRELPGAPAEPPPPATPERRPRAQAVHVGVLARAPRVPALPTAAEAGAMLDECLVGLERAAQDRDMLRAPDLRTLLTRFIEAVHDVLALERHMAEGLLDVAWLRDPAHLDAVARLCYLALWPVEGALLPPAAQAWMLAVDDVARRWQYARRCWLAETCGLTLMPIVPDMTTVNPAWHTIDGTGATVVAVFHPGFLLGDDVLRKAHVRAG